MKITMILFILTFLTACTNPEYLAKREEKLAKENSEKVVYYASNYVGMHEVADRKQLKSLMGMDPSRFEWCAAFVNSILSTKGIPGSDAVSNHPLVARSFLKWGEEVTESPRPGDVVVFPRGRQPWQGHVGFFVTSYVDEGKMYYVILGGNQGNEVSYKVYEARKAISVRRWPTDVNTTVMTMN